MELCFVEHTPHTGNGCHNDEHQFFRLAFLVVMAYLNLNISY